MHPVTAGSGFVTALNLPSLSQLLVHPVPKSLMAHLAGTLDPASLLLHRHRHLPIVHIQSQLQDPIAMLPHTCSVATTARYCLVRFIHRADSLAAGAVSCRLMSSTIGVGTKESFAPPSEPDWQISCIRLSSWWLTFKKIGKPQCTLVLRKTSQPRRSRYLAIGVDRHL